MAGKLRFSIVFSMLFLMAGVALAGWHAEDDIQNLEGITGTYTWFDETMVPASIQFTERQIHGAVDGTYRIFQACWEFSWDQGWHQEECEIETGSFHSVGNNPAIGWAFISLYPDDEDKDYQHFIVKGMLTDDSTGNVVQLHLQKVLPDEDIAYGLLFTINRK
jgi:hypothetical protein